MARLFYFLKSEKEKLYLIELRNKALARQKKREKRKRKGKRLAWLGL